MNDSNTELPPPDVAVDDASEPVDNPVHNPPPIRILVVGNPPRVWENAVLQGIVDFYATVDQTPARLVLTDDRAGQIVAGVISNHEIHHVSPGRNPLRKAKRVMTADHFSHAVVFRYGDSAYTEGWIEFLRELHQQKEADGLPLFTTTLIQLDVIE